MPYKTNTYSPKRGVKFGGGRSGRDYRGGQRHRSVGGARKEHINPSRFIKQARLAEAEAYIPEYSFNDFEINELIKQNLRAMGYSSPSPIQDKTIPQALVGRDIIGIADTGTGKTAAFGIPLLHQVVTNNKRALIMAPTRELAQQIEQQFRAIARGSGLNGAVLIGGERIRPQLRDLRTKPQVVIGTPGRIKDHLERGSLSVANFKLVVLDEVDRMLDMGFIGDMQDILGQLPSDRQSLFFSATLNPRVRGLIGSFSSDPLTISIKSGDSSDNVHQDIVHVSHNGEKLDKLHSLLIEAQIEKAIIFDDTQRSVEDLAQELLSRGFKADAIHGGKSQGQRQRALGRFKKSDITILVATDVAARGIDVADISHVINYSTPNSYADYVHRIGRVGRAGRIGYALTFIVR